MEFAIGNKVKILNYENTFCEVGSTVRDCTARDIDGIFIIEDFMGERAIVSTHKDDIMKIYVELKKLKHVETAQKDETVGMKVLLRDISDIEPVCLSDRNNITLAMLQAPMIAAKIEGNMLFARIPNTDYVIYGRADKFELLE